MTGRLEGKVAFVTGAATGIGRASSILMAKEGAVVCVTDLDIAGAQIVVDTIKAAGGRAIGKQVDVTDEAQVKNAIDALIEAEGHIDILHTCAINSVDVSVNDGMVIDLDMATVRRIVDVNLFGAVVCAKYVGKHMSERGSGSIVFTGTTDALVGMAALDSYTMAKGGIHAVMRSLAAGLGEFGVRVNAVVPSFVKTDVHSAWLADPVASAAIQRLHILPVPTPEDVAPVVVFLASDDARAVTGSLYPVDAGYLASKVAGVKEILEIQ